MEIINVYFLKFKNTGKRKKENGKHLEAYHQETNVGENKGQKQKKSFLELLTAFSLLSILIYYFTREGNEQHKMSAILSFFCILKECSQGTLFTLYPAKLYFN